MAQMGSASAACRYLGISAPALAQSISRLEADLGAELFDRSTRPARLTGAGTHVLDFVRRLSAETDALAERLATEAGRNAGTLRIGCGPRWLVNVIPRAIDAFIRRYPEMRVSIVADQMAELSHRLETQEIGLMFGTVDAVRRYSHHEVVEMSADRFTIVARSTHPLHRRRGLTMAELSGESWIVSGPSASSTNILRQLLRAAGLPPVVPRIELSDTLAVAAMLRNTDCVAIVSLSAVRNLSEIDTLDLAFEMPESRSGVIYRRDRTLSDPERDFIDQVRTAFAR
jgi:DNA-binding transcriptional LysR family regulator